MCSERTRVPHDPDYFHAVGLAVISFARLEWNAVWCCQRLQPNYIDAVEQKTAGAIANDFTKLCTRISDQSLRCKIAPLANEFKAVVKERNALMHGKPGTTPNGDQRLFRHGSELSLSDVNAFSDRCVKAGEPLNALLHNELSEPKSVVPDKFASV